MTAPDITIHPNALEAVAEYIYDLDPENSLPWHCVGNTTREIYLGKARAACLAMLNAWPGMVYIDVLDFDYKIILPLQKQEGGE